MQLDFQPVVERVRNAILLRKLRPGEYSRMPPDMNAVPNEYGCADAANILYSIGEMTRDPDERAAAIRTLQDFQDPASGLFREATHHPLHTTAHCLAALELFEAGPRYPVTAVEELLSRQTPREFLDSLDWEGNPWNESHKGAGLYTICFLTGMMTPAWRNDYFDDLDAHADPETGICRRGAATGKQELARHLAGNFHYLFCYLHARRAFPFPEKMIDSCIALYRDGELLEFFGEKFSFLEVDWVFTLHRATRQTPHRFRESRETLREFARKYHAFLCGEPWENAIGGDDLHALFGMVTAVAELQLALPGEIVTVCPLRSVLDRRPFI